MIEKIAKLLNQAENAGTPEEAATFMAKAQELATLHGVELARARYATRSKEKTTPIQRSVTIGLPGEKGNTTLVDLFLGIATANDLRCTIAHNSTRVYAHGFAEDIEVAEALYASLLVQLARFVAEFKKSGTWQNDTVWREGYTRYLDRDGRPCRKWESWDEEYVDGGYKPISWLTARINFQDGFAGRVRHRLSMAQWEERDRLAKLEEERARRPHLDDEGHVTEEFALWLEQSQGIDLDDLGDQTGTVVEMAEILRDTEDEMTQELLTQWKQAKKAQEDEKAGMALVLAAKDKAVEDFYEEKNPHLKRKRVRSWSGSRSAAHSSSARNAGRTAGDRASLGKSGSLPSQRKAIG